MPITIDGNNNPTAGGVGYGDGTELAFTSAGTSGQVLTSNGSSAPSWSALPSVNLATGVTGTLPIANGGTGTTSTTFVNLASNVTGTLPTANGGTGLTTVGTNGQVLSSNGSSLTWVTPSLSAMTLISTQTASSSSALIWTGLTGYANYLLVISNIVVGSSSNTLRIDLGFGATPTYISSNYRVNGIGYGGQGSSSGIRYIDSTSAQISFIPSGESLVQSNAAIYGTFTFYGFSSQAGYTGQLGYTNASTGNYGFMNSTGTLTSGTYPITALRLYMNGGTITSGTASLYGISS